MATSQGITLRVDVQNLPRAAVEAGVSGQMVIRLANPSVDAIKESLHERLTAALSDGTDTPTAERIQFEVEVYDPRADQFYPLEDIEQLGRRARLNIVLRNNEEITASESHLALPARAFSVNTHDGSFRINGFPIYVGEVENSGLGTGLTTWDGSVVLAKYLEYRHNSGANDLVGKRVLEVGAGTGLVGLAAALIEAREVVLTDLEYTMPNLRRNIARTFETLPARIGAVTAEVLDWFNPRDDIGDVDVILASDVVWVEELIPPLVKTMHHIMRLSSVPTTILMSHQQRSVASDTLLFHEMDERGFVRREVPRAELHPEFVSDRISVWEIKLR